MFDWLFDTRVRVRANFITHAIDYYDKLNETKQNVERILAYYEGTRRDKELYLRTGCTTYSFYRQINCRGGGHSLDANLHEIEETAYVEFNCWKSTFKQLDSRYGTGLYDITIVGEEVL